MTVKEWYLSAKLENVKRHTDTQTLRKKERHGECLSSISLKAIPKSDMLELIQYKNNWTEINYRIFDGLIIGNKKVHAKCNLLCCFSYKTKPKNIKFFEGFRGRSLMTSQVKEGLRCSKNIQEVVLLYISTKLQG